MSEKEIYAALRAPFRLTELEWRPQATKKGRLNEGDKALALAYVTARAVAERLSNVLGVDGWSSSHREVELGSTTQSYKGKRTLYIDRVETKVDVDVVEVERQTAWLCTLTARIGDKTVEHTDGSEETDIEAFKGGLSKALVRCAVRLGVGAYLYDLPNVWVTIGPYGKIPDNFTPNLPPQFLPQSHPTGQGAPARIADPAPPAKATPPAHAAPGDPKPVGQVIQEMGVPSAEVLALRKRLEHAFKLVPVGVKEFEAIFARPVDWDKLKKQGALYLHFAEAAILPNNEREQSGRWNKLRWVIDRPDLNEKTDDGRLNPRSAEAGLQWRDWVSGPLYRNCCVVDAWAAKVREKLASYETAADDPLGEDDGDWGNADR